MISLLVNCDWFMGFSFLHLPIIFHPMTSDIILKYFPNLSIEQKDQFAQLGELYSKWNARINVISRKDFDNFYLHHVLHSLSITKVLQFRDYTEILDAGTGGGFPGIPLAIMCPNVRFFLADSIGKKIKVVKEVAKSLGLENVYADHIRVEQVDHNFDFVISRAVTNLPDFLKWTAYKFHQKSFNSIPNGILYLKGGEVKDELAKIKYFKKKVYELPEYFDEPYFQTKKIIHLYK